MLKTVEGIYEQGEIKLREIPDNIPSQTKVIVTFLNHQESEQILPNYRKPGYWEGQVKMSEDFDLLPDEIINTFME